MVEDTQGDHAGQEDAHRAHLLDDERDVEQEELDDQPQRLALLEEVVDLLEEVDEQVDGDEADHDHPEVADEIEQDVAVEKYHGVYRR